MNDYVRSLLEDIFGSRRDLYAPGRVAGANHIAQVTANFCGVGINSAANFDSLLFPHQAGDGCTNRAHTILDGANLLLQGFLLFPVAVGETSCLFSSKINANDKGIRQHRQRKMPRPRWWESAHFIVLGSRKDIRFFKKS